MRKSIKIIIVVCSLLFMIITVAFVFPDLTGTGKVTGIEYSPDQLCHRRFAYFIFYNIQVTPKSTKKFKTAFDQYLYDMKYFPLPNLQNERWHLVKGFHPGLKGWIGETKDMCQTIGCFDEKDKKLVGWLAQNPEIAKILVPKLYDAISQGDYRQVASYRITFFSKSLNEFQDNLKIAEKMNKKVSGDGVSMPQN